jgi:DNA-binding response OmpR family regulator
MSEAERLQLLFVDSEPQVLADRLEQFKQEYDVLTASRVHEALQILEERGIDVVVARDRLPDTSGIELLHWFRLRAPQAARILVVDGRAESCEPSAIRRAQLFRVLTANCAPETLRATVLQAGRAARLGRVRQPLPPSAGASAVEGADAASVAADALRRAAAPSPPVVSPGGDERDGAFPGRAGPADGEDPLSCTSRVKRVWSTHGITVEEEHYEDPDDTARVFATMLEQAEKRRSAALDASRPAISDPTVAPMQGAAGARQPAVSGTSRDAGRARHGGADAGGASAAPRAPRDDDPGADISAGDSAPGDDRAERPGDGAAILVLSDDAITAAEVRIAAAANDRVRHAATVADAIDALCREQIDLIVLDGRSRTISGVERAVRVLHEVAPEPRFVLISRGGEAGAHDGFDPALGIVGLVEAPIARDALADAINWAVESDLAAGFETDGVTGTDAASFAERLRSLGPIRSSA